MIKQNRWYYSQAFLLTIGLGLAFFLQNHLQANQNRVFLLPVPIIALIINLAAIKATSSSKNPQNFNLLITKIFGIKFFSYLAITIIFFVLEKEKEQRLVFIGFLFVEYLINTVSLLRYYIKSQKTIS